MSRRAAPIGDRCPRCQQVLDPEPLLEEWFRFHELAAEDALSPNTLPKYDSVPRYDFFIFRSIAMNVIEHGVESDAVNRPWGALEDGLGGWPDGAGPGGYDRRSRR